MSNTTTTTAVWAAGSDDAAYTTPRRVRALLAAVEAQHERTTEPAEQAALSVGAALLRGALLDETPRRAPLPLPGVVLGLLLTTGGEVADLAAAALEAAGW